MIDNIEGSVLFRDLDMVVVIIEQLNKVKDTAVPHCIWTSEGRLRETTKKSITTPHPSVLNAIFFIGNEFLDFVWRQN